MYNTHTHTQHSLNAGAWYFGFFWELKFSFWRSKNTPVIWLIRSQQLFDWSRLICGQNRKHKRETGGGRVDRPKLVARDWCKHKGMRTVRSLGAGCRIRGWCLQNLQSKQPATAPPPHPQTPPAERRVSRKEARHRKRGAEHGRTDTHARARGRAHTHTQPTKLKTDS